MKLSRYFERPEFRCKCGCDFAAVDLELAYILTQVREKFGPVVITSGCRCADHNRTVGGHPRSYHLHGMAADFYTPVEPPDVASWLRGKYPQRYGIGDAKTFTHLDVRPTMSRWSYGG